MAITEFRYQDSNEPEWTVTISDRGVLRKNNPSRYNSGDASTRHRRCRIRGCTNTFKISRTTGICNDHLLHTTDLLLEVNGSRELVPTHTEIIDNLIDWALPRSFKLEPFFEELAFNILGNIPDVTTLNGDTEYFDSLTMSLERLTDQHMWNIVDKFFPSGNTSSYQKLSTPKGEFSVRTLAVIFAGLVICEEANRGDRWCYRNLVKKEADTKMLGGAMSLAYFAARRFNWGTDVKKVLPKAFAKQF